MFDITMGVPEMKEFWDDLKKRVKDERASKSDKKLYKKLGKAFYHLSIDPYHPSLNTHEITEYYYDHPEFSDFENEIRKLTFS